MEVSVISILNIEFKLIEKRYILRSRINETSIVLDATEINNIRNMK